MGLDMYAYAAAAAAGEDELIAPNHREIAYWRKHPNLHGWMEQLWRDKNNLHGLTDAMFNGVELELTWDDITDLETHIKEGMLPDTSGFFFGSNSDCHYYAQDMEFISEARTQIFLGFKVFYNSSW
jgi:hypothetical protein